jgi:probable HAF family extracellular repeat protein
MAIREIATLDDPPGTNIAATGINNLGQIAGSYLDNFASFVGFLQLTPGIITTFKVPRIGFIFGTTNPVDTVGDLNDQGLVVGSTAGMVGKFGPPETAGFIYNSGNTNTTLLFAPSSLNTQAFGINNAGQVVGVADSGGFLYSGGTFTSIDDPLAQSNNTVAHGINDSGQIVGNFYDGTSFHGFLYSGGNFMTLDDPLAAQGTFANGINNSGQIVGYYADASGVHHGFLYSAGTHTTIDDPFATRGTTANSINDQGQIVGSYADATASHGFLTGSVGPFANTDWSIVGAGDFNGNGTADLAWQRNSDHLVELQFFVGTTPVSGGIITNSPFDFNWSVVAQADFNGDGKQDLLYRRASDGFAEVQLLNGTTGVGGGAISNNPFDFNWTVAAAGDFNGDGTSDLAWRRQSDGLLETQFLNGSTSLGGGVVANNPFDKSWNVVAKGDFNGDGKTDLVWQRPSDGLVEIELLNGTSVVGGGLILNSPFDSSWQVAGAGDFNGDGKADLVWRRPSDGLTEIQYLDSTSSIGGGAIANNPFDSSWAINGVADFNGDGQPDLVWRRGSDGLTEIQFLSGTTVIGGGVAASLGLGLGTHDPQLINF